MKIILTIVLLLMAGAVVSCEISIWSECRTDHSWLYCVRILGFNK